MNVQELRTALAKCPVSRDRYRILEPTADFAWCLRRVGRTWLVFYCERGSWALKRFKTESHACEYFFNQVVR
ncbi:hypothetical protein GCM10022419_020020 [Nonomuraea rosea]|uniref:Uncharacterized protein n=1 Tax=Nonomuraea rosea TaxID=638574 RepID=A0ABP6VUC2_9ACTN